MNPDAVKTPLETVPAYHGISRFVPRERSNKGAAEVTWISFLSGKPLNLQNLGDLAGGGHV